MRRMHWLGGSSLALVISLAMSWTVGGCSGDDELADWPWAPAATHTDGSAESSVASQAHGGEGEAGERRSGEHDGGADVSAATDGGAEAAVIPTADGSTERDGAVDGGALARDAGTGRGDAMGADGASRTDAARDAMQVDGAAEPDGGGRVLRDAQVDAFRTADAQGADALADAKSDASRDGGAVVDATVDAQAVGADVVVHESVDARPPERCALTTGNGVCEVTIPFATQSLAFGNLAFATCPQGPNPQTDVCVGHARLTNAWKLSPDGQGLDGTLELRISNADARVQFGEADLTCSLVVGGLWYAQIPVRIALPPGKSATDFVPGCTPVSAPEVTLLASTPYTMLGDLLCTVAGQAAQAIPGFDLLKDGVVAIVSDALTHQSCLVR